MHLRHDGDEAVVLAGAVDVPGLEHGDVRLLVVDHAHAVAVGEGRLVGETRQPRLEQLRVQSHAHTLALVKLGPATEGDNVKNRLSVQAKSFKEPSQSFTINKDTILNKCFNGFNVDFSRYCATSRRFVDSSS